LDYKTGYSSQPAACDSWQLRFLALAGCRAYGLKRAVVALVYLRDDLPPAFDRAEFTADDLARFESKLGAAMRAVLEARWEVRAGRVPQTHRGEWCTFCPALTTCPSHMAVLPALLANPSAIADLEARLGAVVPSALVAAMDPAKRGEALDMLKVWIPWLLATQAALKDSARQHPIQHADGSVTRTEEVQRRALEPTKTEQVLVELNMPDVAARVVVTERKATLERLLAALSAEQRPFVLEALKRAGALTSKPFPMTTRVRPKEAKPRQVRGKKPTEAA